MWYLSTIYLTVLAASLSEITEMFLFLFMLNLADQ